MFSKTKFGLKKVACKVFRVFFFVLFFNNCPGNETVTRFSQKPRLKLQSLLNESDAIFVGRLDPLFSKDEPKPTRLFTASADIVLVGDEKKIEDAIVSVHFRRIDDNPYFEDSRYINKNIRCIYFLQKIPIPPSESFNEEKYFYGIHGITKGYYGIIPLEPLNEKLIHVENIDDISIDWVKQHSAVRFHHLTEEQKEKVVAKIKQGEKKRAKTGSTTDFSSYEKKPSYLMQSVDAIKQLYGIDVIDQKETFIEALKLLIDNQGPDEDTPADVREMVKILKSVNWTEPEKPSSPFPFKKNDRPENASESFIIIDSE